MMLDFFTFRFNIPINKICPSKNKILLMKTVLSFCVTRQCRRLILFLCLMHSGLGFAQLPLFLVPPVRITSPANHATFYAPVDIPIFAFARFPASVTGPITDPGNLIGESFTNVEFFAGTNNLGSGFNLGSTVPVPTYANFITARPIPRLGNIYCLTWTNVAPGTFALTAVATASGGLSRTSAPVNITILASTTNFNPADVVSIVATDPIAIAGTNAYVWRGVANATPSWTNWSGTIFQWFTNWGPKDALFTVQRFGDAGSNLTVNYSIGGTASNGVDYAALPGYATVPAGAAYTLIPVVPIDNGASNVNKTVILTLTASTNMPPNYTVGFPPRAAALILENWLRPPSAILPGGSFHLAATGPDGAWFYIQYSTDLVNWLSICTNQVFQGSIDFVDPDSPNNASRFYRAVPVDNFPSH